jgi:hypothetical protein
MCTRPFLRPDKLAFLKADALCPCRMPNTHGTRRTQGAVSCSLPHVIRADIGAQMRHTRAAVSHELHRGYDTQRCALTEACFPRSSRLSITAYTLHSALSDKQHALQKNHSHTKFPVYCFNTSMVDLVCDSARISNTDLVYFCSYTQPLQTLSACLPVSVFIYDSLSASACLTTRFKAYLKLVCC